MFVRKRRSSRLRRAAVIYAVSMHRFDEVVIVISYMADVVSRMVRPCVRHAYCCCVRLALCAAVLVCAGGMVVEMRHNICPVVAVPLV
jgi:hypothetical protein